MAIRSDITVDWESSPRVITVLSPSTEVTIQDLVDTCRDHEDRPANMGRPYLIDAAGKEPLGGVVYVGVTATLQNAVIAFEARLGPTWVLCKISGGNIVAVDDVGAPIDPRLPTAYITVDRSSSSSATLLEQEAIEFSSFENHVTVDITSIYSGTTYPVGTHQQPVNNLVDALLIAEYRGFHHLHILGSMTIDSGLVFDQFIIEGESHALSTITIAPAASVIGCEFRNAAITGTLDGNSTITGCAIGTLNFVNGTITNCVLNVGTIVLGGGTQANILDCWSGVPGSNTPVIDMGGSGQSLGLRNYNGGIKLINKSGADDVSIDMNSGSVILDSTVTNGIIVIRGIGTLTDNSVGATVNANDLINSDTIERSVWDADLTAYTTKKTAGNVTQADAYSNIVAIDTVNGEAGTTWPIGTHQYPVDNIVDALIIAANRGLDRLMLHDSVTIGATDNISGLVVESFGKMDITVTLTAGCSADQTAFRYLNLQGEVSIGDTLLVESCSITGALNNFTGILNTVAFLDGSSLHIDAWATIMNCLAGGQPTNEPEIDLNTSATTITGWNGNLKLTGKTADNRTLANFVGGNVIIDSTCVIGKIQLLGTGQLEADNSGASCQVDTDGFITRALIAQAVWDENLVDHINDETTGHAVMQLAYGGKIFIDTINGSVGTTYPNGIRQHPTNNMADALVIAATYDLATIHIIGSLTISGGEDLSGLTFTSDRSIGNTLNIVSAVTNGTYFDNLTVSGIGNGTVRFTYCVIDGFSDLEGGIKNSLLTNNISYLAGSSVKNYMTDCDRFMTLEDTYIDINVADTSFNMIRGRGNYNIVGKTSIDITTLDLNGSILIDSTCIAGTIVVAGLTRLIDESGPGCLVLPAVLTNATIADAAWDELKAGHIDVGSFGEAVQGLETQLSDVTVDLDFIKAIEGGRWRITGNQMIFYEDDNTTEIARFNLFDAAGDPAEEDVFERQRV